LLLRFHRAAHGRLEGLRGGLGDFGVGVGALLGNLGHGLGLLDGEVDGALLRLNRGLYGLAEDVEEEGRGGYREVAGGFLPGGNKLVGLLGNSVERALLQLGNAADGTYVKWRENVGDFRRLGGGGAIGLLA